MSELKHILISAYRDEMIAFLTSHPEYFDEAIALSLSDDQPFSWRAAWLLFNCMEENDPRVRKHLRQIIKTLPARKDGHQREFLKILLHMELDETHESRLFDLCLSIWEQPDKSPSVRFTAFRFILKMTEKYPELSNETTGLTQDWYLDTLSPGIKRSIQRMVRDTARSRR